MVEAAHHRLSISAQCPLLRISRSRYYYALLPETHETLAPITVVGARIGRMVPSATRHESR